MIMPTAASNAAMAARIVGSDARVSFASVRCAAGVVAGAGACWVVPVACGTVTGGLSGVTVTGGNWVGVAFGVDVVSAGGRLDGSGVLPCASGLDCCSLGVDCDDAAGGAGLAGSVVVDAGGGRVFLADCGPPVGRPPPPPPAPAAGGASARRVPPPAPPPAVRPGRARDPPTP